VSAMNETARSKEPATKKAAAETRLNRTVASAQATH
jgi:hypothetical protein